MKNKTFATPSMGAALNYRYDKRDHTYELCFGHACSWSDSQWVDADDLEALAEKFQEMARKLRRKEAAL